MKRVDRYQANDGVLFLTVEEAVERDEIIANVERAMAPLGKRNEDALQRGWVHHRPSAVTEAKIALLKLARPIFKDHTAILKAIDEAPETVHPHSFVGRALDDFNIHPLKNAWYRFRCIDKEGREHNQPYFSMHDPNTQHVCVEDRR